MPSQEDVWADDLIGGRRESAEMLYQLVIHKSAEQQYREKEALCFTLDGDWGAGKTFFLDRFTRQIELQGHSVVRFDAWVNDLSEQPLLGFMVELREALQTIASEGARPSHAAQMRLKHVMKNAGKALLPAMLAAAKHTAMRTLGEEAVEAVTGISNEATGVDGQEIALKAGEAFSAALDGYQDMRKAVGELRMSIASLLAELEEENRLKLPLFVVIDELDRCRPSYALRLLEGVKHLFASPNVCFVVATNTKQLSESVRAVYGAGFDGHQYLKKFFAFEFRIPTGSSLRFASTLLTQQSVLVTRKSISGLPGEDTNHHQRISAALDLVAKAFRLTPRSLKQVLFVAEAAALGIPSKHKPHAIYLLAVAACAHSDPHALPTALRSKNPRQEVAKVFEQLEFIDRMIADTGPNHVSLRTLLLDYATWSTTDLGTLMNNNQVDWNNASTPRYPRILALSFSAEIPSDSLHTHLVSPSITKYPELVITAGCFLST